MLPKKIYVELFHQEGKVFWQCKACEHLNVLGYQDCGGCSGTFNQTIAAQVVEKLEWIGTREEYEKRTLEFLESEMKATNFVEAMDDRKLLWFLMETDFWKSAPMVGVDGALLDALSDRLYPEYDGETVYATETGWHTPEGEITYRELPANQEAS